LTFAVVNSNHSDISYTSRELVSLYDLTYIVFLLSLAIFLIICEVGTSTNSNH
jgi:hypothetical protein